MHLDWRKVVIGSAIVVVLAIIIIQTIGSPSQCQNAQCFLSSALECKKAVYVNEEAEASWGYEILGRKDGSCRIEVTLLNAKEGTLNLRKYEGNTMVCEYQPAVALYPEQSLDYCHGELKENLQAVIIEKLYKYIIDNLGAIGEGIDGI